MISKNKIIIVPKNDFLLLEIIETEGKAGAGIILADRAKESLKEVRAVIKEVSVGNEYKVGDEILADPRNVTMLPQTVEGIRCVFPFIHIKDVLAVLKRVPDEE